ncbi:hypothetical protein J8273_4730 [Carpediemonas membranifera]|uniref:Uncharacterized protein n=1 Tax=Carpediemonas membranifera TaxID=201153 RepID=A0A8J6E247_9EUKA|nr:hypothetical protein J8273_4730 [Carpediemonas membranifera]|eukprot:KAG9393866.1 hypothetical protein J8273_4730 [Carpediemonas membranifera]
MRSPFVCCMRPEKELRGESRKVAQGILQQVGTFFEGAQECTIVKAKGADSRRILVVGEASQIDDARIQNCRGVAKELCETLSAGARAARSHRRNEITEKKSRMPRFHIRLSDDSLVTVYVIRPFTHYLYFRSSGFKDGSQMTDEMVKAADDAMAPYLVRLAELMAG